MNSSLFKRTLLVSFSACCLLMALNIIPSKTNALSGNEFQAGYISADSVFFNPNTMSAGEIQNFLNAKVPSCDTNGTQSSGRWNSSAGRYYTRGEWGSLNGNPPPYTCLRDFTQNIQAEGADTYCSGNIGAGTKSAATIIYEVSNACGINPQAMLVLLQKEQSLITDDWPWPTQYRSATGYGCPDTAPCDAEYYGFFNQIYNAAHQFQRYSKAAHLFNHRGNQTSFVLYNPNSSCGGSNVFMQSQATAGLYNYTPYQPNQTALNNLYGTGDACSAYGNRNFWRMFNDWFGSPIGDLVRTNSDATVYLISDNTKYPIADINILNDFGRLGPVRHVTDTYISQKTTGPTVGRMVRGSDGSIYLVNAGIKLGFTSCSGDIIDYGYTCDQPLSSFVNLTQGQTFRLVNGPPVTKFIKANNDGTIYYMSAGKKRPLTSWRDLTNLNLPISINVFTSALVNQYQSGAVLYGPGSLVKTADSGTVYIAKDPNTLMPISSFIYPQELGLDTHTRTMSGSDFQGAYSSAQGAIPFVNKISCNSNNYIGTSGRVYSVSNGIAANFGFNLSDFVEAGGICPNINLGASQLTQYIRTSDGTIYYVSSGTKRAFTTMAMYQSASYCNNSCTLTHVSSFFANSVPSGANL